MARRLQVGAALGLLCVLGGCSAVPEPSPPTQSAVALGNLMDLVPGGARVLMGMGSAKEAGVSAVARLDAHGGTELTLVAVCAGPGTLHLDLGDDKGLVVPCDQKIMMADVPAGAGAGPDTVSITLEPGNSYSTLVYAAGSAPES